MSDFMCVLLPQTQWAVINHRAGHVSLEEGSAVASTQLEQLVNISHRRPLWEN